MKRVELYKNLLENILKQYSGINSGSDDFADVQDYLDDRNIIQALDKLISTVTLQTPLKPLLQTISNFIADGSVELDATVQVMGHIMMFQKHSDKKYSRPLSYFDDKLKVVEICTLYKSASETYSLESLLLLEIIMTDMKRQKKLLKELCQQAYGDTYIIQFDKTAIGLSRNEKNDYENLYAYALAASMNNKKVIDIPKGLQFSWGTTPILASFNYNKDIVYKEYYDIYDVLNDWLHAEDILTAFLKMYQIAEYMVYRKQMAEIVNRANVKQSFLRETKNLSSKYTKNERDTVISNLSKIFSNFTLDATEVANTWYFVDKYFGTKNGNHYLDTAQSPQDIDKGVARFIYDTRCAIVHNKESEFHILYNNYDEYKDIVPLMFSINKIMSEKIMEIINVVNPPIHYNNQKLDLY